MEDFENITDEEAQMLMELGIIPEQLDSLSSQIDQAQKLRNRKGPEGTYAGRVYVAANPLEHIAHAVQGIKAGRDIDRMRAEQQALLQRQVAGRSSYLDKLREIQPVEPSVRRAPMNY